MSETELRDAESDTTPADDFEKEFGDRFSDDEKSRMDSASQALSKNEPGSRKNPDRKSLRNLISQASKKRKLAALGGGGVAVGGGIIGLMLALSPLRIMNLVTHLEDYFYGPLQSAVQAQTETLFNHYLQKHVMKSLTISGVCSSTKTITKDCIDAPAGSNPVQVLYAGWRDGRIENKLATSSTAPFELKRTPDGKYWLKMAIFDGNGVDISDFGRGEVTSIFDSDGFGNVKRKDARKAARQVWMNGFQHETKWKNALFYFKIGRLLESKYGIKRCALACDLRDRWGDKVSDAKFAGKAYFIERVVQPRSAMAAVALSCLMSTCNVNPELNEADVDLIDNGEPKSEFDRKLRTSLVELSSKYGTERLNNLVKEVNILKEAGSLEKYLAAKAIEQALKALGVSGAGELATKAAGPVGWVLFAARVVNFSVNAGPILVKMNYEVNAAQGVATFAMLATAKDEMKNHDASFDKTGSMNDLLEKGMRDDGTGVSAEAVPIVQSISNGSNQTASIFDSIFPTAFADETVTANGPEKYGCDNNTHPDTCMDTRVENALTKSSYFLGEIPGMQFIAQIAGLAGNIVDGVLSPIIDLITKVPPFSNLTELLSSTFAPLVGVLVGFILVNQMKNPDGGRIGDGAFFGANISGNHSMHRLGGGKKIVASQRAEIMESFYADKRADFESQSLAYRLFNTNDNMSLVAQAASSYPSFTSGEVQSNVASLIGAPFASFSSTLASMFTTRRTYAAITVDMPQGVTQYGIPLDDPELKNDPEVVHEKYKCSDPQNSLTAAYNKASIGEEDTMYGATGGVDQETQQAENTSANYCALQKTSIAAAGAMFTSKVLSADDLNSGSQATSTSGGGATTITGNENYEDASPGCPVGTTDLGTVRTRYTGSEVDSPYPTIRLCRLSSIGGEGNNTSGVETGGGAVVNKAVAAAFQAMGEKAKADGVPLRAGSSFRLADSCGGVTNNPRCADPGKSNHQLGIAIDFSNMGGVAGSDTSNCSNRRTYNSDEWRWMHENAAKFFGIKQLTHESWHWDTSKMSNRCA